MTRIAIGSVPEDARLEPLARLLAATPSTSGRSVILCKAIAEADAGVAFDVVTGGYSLSLFGATTAPTPSRGAAMRQWIDAVISHFGLER